jgi:chromosome segregation ATPase
LEKELRELKTLLETEKREKSYLQQELNRMKDSKTTTATPLTPQSSQDDLLDLRKQLEKEISEKNAALHQVSELQKINEQLRTDVMNKEIKVRKTEEALEDAKRAQPKTKSSDDEVKRLRSQLDKLTSENSSLLQTINERNRDLRTMREQLRQQQLQAQPAVEPIISPRDSKRQSSSVVIFLQDCMTKILHSQNAENIDLDKFRMLVNEEQGRRIFTQVLKQAVKTVKSKALPQTNFELLLWLINPVLQKIDLSDR